MVVDVDVDADAAPAVDPVAVRSWGPMLDVGVLRRTLVVVLASARSPVTSDGSGGVATRAGAHAAQHRIPAVAAARRRGFTAPMMTTDRSPDTSC